VGGRGAVPQSSDRDAVSQSPRTAIREWRSVLPAALAFAACMALGGMLERVPVSTGDDASARLFDNVGR